MTGEIVATYRLQLEPGFRFDAAAELAPYLAALGVSHVYCSPYLQAAPGSTHGYDVVDPTRVNEELGGADAHQRFCAALRRCGLGQILDIVPNHMAIGTERNRWWWDVLENGPSSRYAAYFDVDWEPPEERYHNLIVLPVLGDQYGRILEAGELRLARNGVGFTVHYADHCFPFAPRALDEVLGEAAERSRSETLAFLGSAFGRLPAPTAVDRESVTRRHRDKEVLRRLLARLLEEEPATAAAIDTLIAEVNGTPARLHSLLERQNYRLAFWRVAGRDLGYRRFFDINTLVGLRIEDAHVFDDTHALILRWLGDDILDGVRIDHPDGLRDPEGYLQKLRAAAPQAWIFVEKILEPGESLPPSWPVEGTTGYDFMNVATGVLVDPDGEQPLTDLYADFTGETVTFAEMVHDTKLLVLRDLLGSDVRRLAGLFLRICERHPRHRDHTREELEEALRAVIARFPVYRTYVRAQTDPTNADTRVIDEAIESTKIGHPDLDEHLLMFLGRILRREARGDLETELALRFQQVTGPAMAKGVEDTAFYRFHRLVCLNEVGGDPGRFGVNVGEFHRWCTGMQRQWPRTMLATSTHDTKRSEDVRARLALLSEIAERWGGAVRRWSEKARRYRRNDMPDAATEYLLYQTLVGAWPIAVDRVIAYLEKAVREAKAHTSWTRQSREYEEALRSFVEGVFADRDLLADIETFVTPLIEPGLRNSLSQILLKLTAPGVPDLYRGTELWDFSLVDPDNRRPVDWKTRRRVLDELAGLAPERIWERAADGLPKVWTIRQALALRRRKPAAFGPEGKYEPLEVRGPRAHHAVAFARGGAVVTVVPRLVLRHDGDWSGTTLSLPRGCWRNELTADAVDGGDVDPAILFSRFPVALLSREDGNG